MQSEMQQIPANKSPYLSQYRNDISAKQKLIRQRLGTSVDSPGGDSLLQRNTSQQQQDGREIPSIDDDETVEQITQDRRYKSRFSYFDNEAEASLQFFKKNLLPNSTSETKSTSKATGNLFDKLPGLGSTTTSRADSSSKLTTAAERTPRPLSERYEPRASTLSWSSKANQAPRPLPIKQTSLNERSTAETSLSSNNQITNRRGSLSSRTSVEKPPNEQVANLRSSSSQRQRSNRSKSAERDNTANGAFVEQHSQSTQPPSSHRTEPKSVIAAAGTNVVDGRQSAESQSQSGTFSRKPLYNSLLRAHDSIRLKVNRPKVRPKSEVVVPDTEIDDSIQLADLDSQSSLHERAVDVKRGSSRRKSKKKEGKTKMDGEIEDGSKEKIPVRNFSEVRVVKIVRDENERSLGVTVKAEDGNIVVARIMAGSLADKQAALQVGDIILAVDNREVYTPEQLQEQLRRTMNEDTVLMKIVPSFREELPTLCIYLRALFTYDANEDSLLPCKEVGVSFNQGDILEVVNQEDPNWWQARRVDSDNLQTGLIPSQELEERRRAFVIPDYDLATRTSICGTKVTRKSKKKEIYNLGQNSDFDKAELQLYEEVCRTPAFERRTLVLIGANGVGKQALKAHLIALDPDRFGAPVPHTSRLPREGEEDGVHYNFVTREKMEEDIMSGKYLEYGEHDGALYGTKLDSVREIIGSGKVCVLDCSATCLKILKTSNYLPFVAFIAAPTLDQLRYMHEWARTGNKNYTTLDRALSRQSRRARTLQDFAFDFFEDEDLQVTVEESARLFRVYENYFDIVLVNNNFERTFEQLKDAIDALSMAPQWIPISWIYGTT